MRIAHTGSALALAVSLMGSPALAGDAVKGDYVEARTCNVFIGACHYSGEAVTTGREAVIAWNVREGARAGVKLAGLSAAAVIAANRNLGERDAERRTILYIDTKATPAQRDALVGLLKETHGRAFGSVVAVRSAPIEFAQTASDYRVKIGRDAQLAVRKTADDTCCQQPMQVWYRPLGPVTKSAVGFTTVNEFTGSGLPATWSRADQNSSFYGEFAF